MGEQFNVRGNDEVDILKGEVLFDNGDHQFIWLGWEEKDEGLVQVNQYLIKDGSTGILLDPGGIHVFPRIVGNVSRYIDLDKIKYIFYTHQDPDVSSGITLWLSVTPAKIYISKWWIRFLAHFGVFDTSRIVPLEDKGGNIPLPSGKRLDVIPAHFLHSTGNFSLYDPIAKILFTGDIGAALFPHNQRYLFVEDFEKHTKLMQEFHERFLAGNTAIKTYLQKISKYDIQMIAPQHGSIFPDKETSQKFLNWLNNTKCGIDIINKIYG